MTRTLLLIELIAALTATAAVAQPRAAKPVPAFPKAPKLDGDLKNKQKQNAIGLGIGVGGSGGAGGSSNVAVKNKNDNFNSNYNSASANNTNHIKTGDTLNNNVNANTQILKFGVPSHKGFNATPR